MTDETPIFETAMPGDESPISNQEIVSAINHHARELARLTETWPVDSAPPPPDVQRDAERWGVVLHNAAATDALFKVFDPHDEHRHINNAIDAARAAQAKEGGL